VRPVHDNSRSAPLDLVPALEAFKAAAHGLGYACRTGIKTNAKGELVVALIFPPLAEPVDAREAKRLERERRS
jgi:hypothetical protein